MNSLKQIIIQIIIGVILVFALTYGRPVTSPDNVTKLYGFPITWGTHLISSIAGPVDTWLITPLSLIADLLIWITLMIVAPFIADRLTIETCRKCIGRL